MKEALGNSFLINIALFFLFLTMGILVSSFTYSKGYKIKNRIINVIEKYGTYDKNVENELNDDLKKLGYRVNMQGRSCASLDKMTLVHNIDKGSYDYCIYKVDSKRGTYYHVVAYTHFDLPIIGEYISLAIKGDTKTFFNINKVEG